MIANEVFCEAHGLDPGDSVVAVVNGRRRRLVVTGIGLSPEFVYSIKPGELYPDNRRYGVFWMGRDALAAAFDMTGAFNDVSLALTPTAVVDEVVAEVDRTLARPAAAAPIRGRCRCRRGRSATSSRSSRCSAWSRRPSS